MSNLKTDHHLHSWKTTPQLALQNIIRLLIEVMMMSGSIYARLVYHTISLYGTNYQSIGYNPCTRALTLGKDERAGRWWWGLSNAASKCGLHMNPIKKTRWSM